ncbi:dimethylsulfonioproprionate lyase family protein [Agrobacterium cavarae]|uniref:dimethylsulfonioproprionate lyase family protein n=1 Tax=Agrobacterium cavarae TaxID=2528239 RepID=UPI003EE7E5FC
MTILAPQVRYPDHNHLSTNEVYLFLSDIDFWQGDGPWKHLDAAVTFLAHRSSYMKCAPIKRRLWRSGFYRISCRARSVFRERSLALTPSFSTKFHNIHYATLDCSRKVKMSCFCKVRMSHSPGLIDLWETADGTDYDERARPA